jgi:hypothetical protein
LKGITVNYSRAFVTVSILLFSFSLAQTLSSRPAESVISSPIAVSNVTASSAELVITTGIDLACLVVFGTDETFGQMAFDTDMGTAAHQHHRVVMRGLEPSTTYLYRLQGSAPDGTFYASSIYSFTTSAAEATPSLGVNVATLEQGAKVIAASSEFSSSYGANNALDNNPSSEWSSRGDGNEAFITIELPNEVTVTGFGLWTRTMGSSAEISRFEVENEKGETFGPFDLEDANSLYQFPATGTGKQFTFRVLDSSGGNTGAIELAIYVAP